MSNLIENSVQMKGQTFGVEIEMSRMSQEKCAKLVQALINEKRGTNYMPVHNGRHLNDWNVFDDKNGETRKWKVYSDASLCGTSCELVTPICKYDDIELIQEIIRMLRTNGAVSNADYGCGVHIHIGIGDHTPKTIRNLVNVVNSHQAIIKKAIGFSEGRSTYCNVLNETLVRLLNAKKPRDWSTLKTLHYRTLGGDESHYSRSRYYFLNLHAIWDKGTVEFRCFEFHKNMHAGEMKAYIQLCLAMSNYAKMVAYSSPNAVDMTNEKWSMKNWLNNMGLIGDEFKTARKMLTKRLSGDLGSRIPRTATAELDDIGLE